MFSEDPLDLLVENLLMGRGAGETALLRRAKDPRDLIFWSEPSGCLEPPPSLSPEKLRRNSPMAWEASIPTVWCPEPWFLQLENWVPPFLACPRSLWTPRRWSMLWRPQTNDRKNRKTRPGQFRWGRSQKGLFFLRAVENISKQDSIFATSRAEPWNNLWIATILVPLNSL